MVTRIARRPGGHVARFVAELWLVRMEVPAPVRMTLLPDGTMSLLINLADAQKRCDGHPTEYRRSWVSGAQPTPIELEISGRYEAVGVAFRPGGAAPLFAPALGELAGRVVELEDLWGARARELRERLGATRNDVAKLRVLEAWLARAYRDAELCRRTRFAVAQLERRDVNARVGEIAGALGISAKHLVAQYERQTGLTPRYFARVRRMQATIARVGQTAAVDWAAEAVAGGYYDQSHLINEFKLLTGSAPREYLARRTPFLGYLQPRAR